MKKRKNRGERTHCNYSVINLIKLLNFLCNSAAKTHPYGILLLFSVGHRYQRVQQKDSHSTKRNDYLQIE